MSRIIDAVSVILCCGDEIFAIERQPFLKSFPGYWAFPGGKVEANDGSPLDHELLAGIEPHLWGAVQREILEELGVDLDQLLERGSVSRVTYLGLAVTPDFNPYRFATYFYKIDLLQKPTFVVDTNEAKTADWFACHELLRRYEVGQLLAVPPIVRVLRALGEDIARDSIPGLNFQYDPQREVPMIESLKGVRQFMPRSHTLPPASRTNCFHLGDEASHQFIVDPSPESREEMQRLIHALEGHRVDAIMLTHHHSDHHQHAVDLARYYGVPIWISADSHARLLRIDPHYFADTSVRHLHEGDIVSTWLGEPLFVVAVPGHDEGQLALMPEGRAWFLAGDLFQGVGTVVIGDDEGDMAKYFATLEKVIGLAPKVVFPSHGIGLGSTFILEKTLEHRRLREEQVRRLSAEGRTEDEILATLYSDIDVALLKYARKNIRSHMKKIERESAG
ncbi:MAG: NUDIX domain-containing protein [Bacteriovoracia bacterium]